jgi:hypothetical protein
MLAPTEMFSLLLVYNRIRSRRLTHLVKKERRVQGACCSILAYFQFYYFWNEFNGGVIFGMLIHKSLKF